MRQQRGQQTDRVAALEAEIQRLRVLLEVQKSDCLARFSPAQDAVRIKLIQEAGARAGIGRACEAVGVSRARFYRAKKD
jgi:hypothetical protein